MVYARTVGEKELTLIVSGMLWRDSLIMLDRESGSLWSHVLGSAIVGPMKGRALDMLPSVQTTWREWKEAHPETTLLVKDAEILGSEYQKYYDDPSRMGLFRARRIVERMPGKELVWGVASGPHATAIREGALVGKPRVEFDLGPAGAVAVSGGEGGVRVYIRAAGSSDSESSPGSRRSRSDSGGETGELPVGAGLEEVPVTRVYWFAWSSFYPNTEVVDGD